MAGHSAPLAISVGDALMDAQYWVERIPAPGEDVQILAREENTGGSAANCAIGMGWLSVPCGFFGCLGRDKAGEHIVKMMENTGVDTRLIHWSGSTGYVLSMVDPTGERTMFSYRGASAGSAPLDGLQTALKEAKVVLLSGYMLTDAHQAQVALQIAQMARAAGVKVALDACPKFGELAPALKKQALELCDIFLPNRSELSGSAAGSWQENLQQISSVVPCIAVKMGGQGALLHMAPGFSSHHTGGQPLVMEVPTAVQNPLDTTGAGDAFNAGFLASYLRDETPEMWLKTGNWLAGQVIATRGATGLYKNQPPSQSPYF